MNPGTQFCPQDGIPIRIGQQHACQGLPEVDYSRSMGRAAMTYLSRAGYEPMDLNQNGDHVIFTFNAGRAALQAALPWRLQSLGGNIYQARP